MKKSARFGASPEQSAELSRLLTDDSLSEVGTTELIAIDQIDRDPEQPREILVTEQQLRLRQPPTDPEAQAQYESIADLASNIEKLGLLQPVGVYRHADRFRLSWGERRLLAHIYLGHEKVRCNISRSAPARKAYKQLAENLGRKDLSLREKVVTLMRAMQEDPAKDAGELAAWCGLERSQAFQYWAIIKDQEVVSLISERSLTSVDLAARVARETDPDRRAALLGVPTEPEQPQPLGKTVARPKPDRRGRPPTSVRLEIKGTQTPTLAREICQRLLGKDVFEKQFKGVDFTDLSIANDVVRQVINTLAKSLEAKAPK